MKIPVKIKIINGVKYRYCGNHGNPTKVEPCLRLTLSYHQWNRGGDGLAEAVRNERRWLKDAMLLDPEPTDAYTVKKLKELNSVSVWKPLTGTKS